jgi:hypothetical protein
MLARAAIEGIEPEIGFAPKAATAIATVGNSKPSLTVK